MALPVSANAGLVVPKSPAPAPITTPRASTPQAPAPQAPAPSPVPVGSTTGSSPPGSSAPAPSPQGSQGPPQAPSSQPHNQVSEQQLERWIQEGERELREQLAAGDLQYVVPITQRVVALKNELADLKAARAAAETKAAQQAQEQADRADQWWEANDVDGAAERRALADEYWQAQGLPPEGSYAGIVESILNIFHQPQPGQTGPVAARVPEAPFGEVILVGLSAIKVLLREPSRNSAQS